MKCVICRTGDLEAGRTSYTLNRDGRTFVVKGVPARVCRQCGEPYFDAEVTKRILRQIDDASTPGVEIALIQYRAA